MAFRFPFRFKRRNRIRRLNRSPHSSIKRWLREKKKIVTIDPIKRKKKITKDKKIHVNNLRTVISQLVVKVNEVVEFLQERPEELEKMVLWEIDTREKEIILLTSKHNREMRELEDILTKKIDNNRRLLLANSALDYQDRAALDRNTVSDVLDRYKFERHRRSLTTGLFPMTHYPGAWFEEGGTLDTPVEGRRFEPAGLRTKPKPTTEINRTRNFQLKGNFDEIVEQVYNLQSIHGTRSNQQSVEDIKKETEPYFTALWNDFRDTGGQGADGVIGHFFCTGCSSTNTPGFCGGGGCLSCNGSSMNFNITHGNASGEVTYDFGGSISCNFSLSFQSGGRIKPSGSRTKPKPLTKSQRAKLIDDILSNG